MTHVLVVHEPNPETGEPHYELEHPDGCPAVELDSGLGWKQLIWSCAEGNLWSDGPPYTVANLEELEPGRHSVEAAFSYQPSTVNGPAEWDAWLEVAVS